MLAHVVQRADVRVIQPGDGLRFALEPRPAVRVGGHGRRQHLDRHRPVEARVAREGGVQAVRVRAFSPAFVALGSACWALAILGAAAADRWSMLSCSYE